MGYSSRTEFDAFTDAALVANTSEIAKLASLGSPIIAFAGDRRSPLKTFGNRPPVGWIANNTRLYPIPLKHELMEQAAAAGESIPLQVGLWVSGPESLVLSNQDVVVQPLVPLSALSAVAVGLPRAGSALDSGCPADLTRQISSAAVSMGGASTAIRSLGTEGKSDTGAPIEQSLVFKAGKSGALWLLTDMPLDAETGVWCSKATLTFRGNSTGKSTVVQVPIAVNVTQSEPIPGGGSANTWRLSRLAWIDSQLGFEDVVTRRYTAVKVNPQPEGRDSLLDGSASLAPGTSANVSIAGRIISVNGDGGSLIQGTSAVGPSGDPADMQGVLGEVLVQAKRTTDKTHVHWYGNGTSWVNSTADSFVTWQTNAASHTGDMWLQSNITAWFDGFVEVDFALGSASDKPVPLDSVTVPLPLSEGVCSLVMGMGEQGTSIAQLANST